MNDPHAPLVDTSHFRTMDECHHAVVQKFSRSPTGRARIAAWSASTTSTTRSRCTSTTDAAADRSARTPLPAGPRHRRRVAQATASPGLPGQGGPRQGGRVEGHGRPRISPNHRPPGGARPDGAMRQRPARGVPVLQGRLPGPGRQRAGEHGAVYPVRVVHVHADHARDSTFRADRTSKTNMTIYKRINHFNDWISQIQAKDTVHIPDEVYAVSSPK